MVFNDICSLKEAWLNVPCNFFTKSSNSPNFQMCLISQTRVITACQLCDGWSWSRQGSRMQRMPPSRRSPAWNILLNSRSPVSICLSLKSCFLRGFFPGEPTSALSLLQTPVMPTDASCLWLCARTPNPLLLFHPSASNVSDEIITNVSSEIIF